MPMVRSNCNLCVVRCIRNSTHQGHHSDIIEHATACAGIEVSTIQQFVSQRMQGVAHLSHLQPAFVHEESTPKKPTTVANARKPAKAEGALDVTMEMAASATL